MHPKPRTSTGVSSYLIQCCSKRCHHRVYKRLAWKHLSGPQSLYTSLGHMHRRRYNHVPCIRLKCRLSSSRFLCCCPHRYGGCHGNVTPLCSCAISLCRSLSVLSMSGHIMTDYPGQRGTLDINTRVTVTDDRHS